MGVGWGPQHEATRSGRREVMIGGRSWIWTKGVDMVLLHKFYSRGLRVAWVMDGAAQRKIAKFR